MQRIRKLPKNKKTARIAVFLSVKLNWWSIGNINITFEDGLGRTDSQELRELLDEKWSVALEITSAMLLK